MAEPPFAANQIPYHFVADLGDPRMELEQVDVTCSPARHAPSLSRGAVTGST